MQDIKLSTEELNSNLDYFLDVDVSKENEDLLNTLVLCGKQDCDLKKLIKIMDKFQYTREEIKKFKLEEVENKAFDLEQENIKRVKMEEKRSVGYYFDYKKICEAPLELINEIEGILTDKEFLKVLENL